ncbi:hypothetical protein QTO34_004745 [Cnephaeus nilssonii]|uniref:40S ribosomal protein S8 n=1 Tax=Cnephaeus nilssonii TaxID=3371016 RepID=A0AA40HPV5_CNENI|nr:hypothetical protein QTO34_004745 [Eptesicus nilssonii]
MVLISTRYKKETQSWEERHKTRDKRKPYHRKRKYELGCLASNTKFGPCHIHTVPVRGGNKKYGALRLDSVVHKTRTMDVVYNTSNNELVHTKTLRRDPLHTAPGPQGGAKLTPEEEEILNKQRSKKIQKKSDERTKNAKSAVKDETEGRRPGHRLY